ncbi:MAG: hypothetical protein ACK53L_31190, partial [Pirellulaceae bacterium]
PKHGFHEVQVATDGQHRILDETTRLQLDKNDGGGCGQAAVDPSKRDPLCLDVSVHPIQLGFGMLFDFETR